MGGYGWLLEAGAPRTGVPAAAALAMGLVALLGGAGGLGAGGLGDGGSNYSMTSCFHT